MSRRKPVPYHVAQGIDAARAELAEQKRTILLLLGSKPITAEERMRLLAKVLHSNGEADLALRNALSDRLEG